MKHFNWLWRLGESRALTTVIVACIAVLAGLFLRYQYLLNCEAEVRAYLLDIRVAINKWQQNAIDPRHPVAVELPTDITYYIEHGYLDRCPVNPFTGGPVRSIAPGETPGPGDVAILRAGERHRFQRTAEVHWETGYLIIGYSVRPKPGYTLVQLDADGDGHRDPVLWCEDNAGAETHEIGHSRWQEDLPATLQRNGLADGADGARAPVDYRPLLRFMFFLDPAG